MKLDSSSLEPWQLGDGFILDFKCLRLVFFLRDYEQLMITDMTKICNVLMPCRIFHSMYFTIYGIDNLH